MNARRRKIIDKAEALVNEAKSLIETCIGEESEALDNLPESLQSGEKGEKMQSCIDAMEALCETFDDLEWEEAKGEE